MDEATPIDAKSADEQQEIAQAEEYRPGELAPCIITSAQVWKPDDIQDKSIIGCIQELVKTCSNTDEAARRFQVLQTWEMRHMDRGFQYLEGNTKNGGWDIYGTSGAGKNQNSLASMDDMGLYPTNILSAQGDIATGALNRGKIKVSFTPKRSKNPADVASADMADEYKFIWEKINDQLQSDFSDGGWTDCRMAIWTRSVAAKRFGMGDDGSPAIRELSTAHGVLESKCPMMADRLEDMSYFQIFEEMDYAIARATYPWMGDKIKASWGTYGELEFERIARINTRIGIVGKYITGTSGIREATMGYNWFRTGTYFDDEITAPQREFLLKNFPNGLFVVMSGPDFVCAWDESMDDHIQLGMFSRGFGQNRRSMGSSDLPIQKRINIWADLWDKTVRSAIASILVEDKILSVEALAQMEASPKRFIPIALDENQTMQDVAMAMPVAQLHTGMQEMFQWYVGPLIQSIDGCTPALYGGGEGEDNTVGATQIRLNQALERYGPKWQMMNCVISGAAKQAAILCGENGNVEISDTVAGKGDITINPAILKAGSFEVVAESAGAIPESGAQREAKIMQVLEFAQNSPAVMQMISTSSNTREIVKGLHLDDVITVDEADSEDLALEAIEQLLDAEPDINPDYVKLMTDIEGLNVQHEQAKQQAVAGLASGTIPEDGQIQQGAQMEQGLQQMQQKLQQTPQYLPSVAVVTDGSVDNATITATLFSWMQRPEGRQLRFAASREAEGGPNWKKWTNVHLYWQGNRDAAAQNAQAQAPPPKVALTGKLTPDQQAQILMQQAGIQTSPQSLNAPNEYEQEARIYTPVSEQVIKTKKKL